MLKGSKKNVKEKNVRRAGYSFSLFLLVFLFRVGRPDWSLTLMAINTFTICPKRFYALNNVQTKLLYHSGNFYRVATAVLPPTIHQILLTHIHSTWGRKNSRRGYCTLHFTSIFPHYFYIFQKWMSAMDFCCYYRTIFTANSCKMEMFSLLFLLKSTELNAEMASQYILPWLLGTWRS